MKDEELQQILRELEERIEGMEIDLTPPEESTSNFTVYENAAGDRQMIVHFVDVKDYSIELPTNKEEARSAFLKVIKEHKEHQQRAIAHGDLMVLNCQPCNYYCYVAKVDKFSGTGFQEEDKLDPPAAATDLRGERILHELVIWTETYPGGGADATFEVSAITVESVGTLSTITLNELHFTPKPPEEQPPEIEGSVLDLNYNPAEEDSELFSFKVNNVTPGEKTTGTTIQALISGLKDIKTDYVRGTWVGFNTSQAYMPEPEGEKQTDFVLKANNVRFTDIPQPDRDDFYAHQVDIETEKCYEDGYIIDPDIEEYDSSLDILYGRGDKVVIPDGEGGGTCFTMPDNFDQVWWERSETGEVIHWDSENNTPVQTLDLSGKTAAEIEAIHGQIINEWLNTSPTYFGNRAYEFNGEYFYIDDITAPYTTIKLTDPANYFPGGDDGFWIPTALPLIGSGPEIPCPTKSFNLFEATWEGDDNYEENTYYFGAPKLVPPDPDYPPEDPSIHSVPPLNVKVEFEPSDYGKEYFDIIDGCQQISLKKESQEEDEGGNDTITLLGLSLPETSEDEPEAPKVTIKGLAEGDPEIDIATLIPDRGMNDDIVLGDDPFGNPANALEKRFLKKAKTEIVFDGDPIADPDQTPVDVVEAITGATMTTEAVDSETNTFELILKEEITESSSGVPTSVPVFEEVQNSDCGGCYVIKKGGNLKLETKRYKGIKQEVTIGTQDTKLELTGKKLQLSKQLQKTKIKNKGDYYSALTMTNSYEVELEGSLYDLKKLAYDTTVSIYGQSKTRYEYEEGDLTVSIFQEEAPKIYTTKTEEFEFANKKVSIATQSGNWVGDKFECTAEEKSYLIKREGQSFSSYPYKLEIWEEGTAKKVTVTPDIARLKIVNQMVHGSEKFKTEFELTDSYEYDLTPYETSLIFDKTHDLDVNSSQDSLSLIEAKKLKLVPKEYTLEQFKIDLEYIQKNLDIKKKQVGIGATECKSASVESTDLSSDKIDLWQATVKPKPPIPDEPFWSTEVSVGNRVSIGKELYFDWIDVSIGSAHEPLVLKGISLGNYKYTSAPPKKELFTTELTSGENASYADDDKEWHCNKIEKEDLSPQDKVTVDYNRLVFDLPEDIPDVRVNSTILNIPEEGDPQRIPADSLYVRVTDADEYNGDAPPEEYDRVKTTHIELSDEEGDKIEVSGKVSTANLKKYSNYSTDCEDSSSIVNTEIDISPSSVNIGKTKLHLPVETYDSGDNEKEPEENDGPSFPLVEVTPQESESPVVILPETKIGTSTIITAGEAETLDEWEEATVEYEAASSDGGGSQLYIPQLDACPVNNKYVTCISETGIQNNVKCSVEEDVLTITQEITVDKFEVKCGVFAKVQSANKLHALPTIGLNLKPYYEHTLRVCDSDGEPQNITVLTTTVPESASAEAAGYLIDKNPCPE